MTIAGHELTLSAIRRDETVRMIGTCVCLGWHIDLIVPGGLVRDADRHLRASWLTHAAVPAVAPVPSWLAGDPR